MTAVWFYDIVASLRKLSRAPGFCMQVRLTGLCRVGIHEKATFKIVSLFRCAGRWPARLGSACTWPRPAMPCWENAKVLSSGKKSTKSSMWHLDFKFSCKEKSSYYFNTLRRAIFIKRWLSFDRYGISFVSQPYTCILKKNNCLGKLWVIK